MERERFLFFVRFWACFKSLLDDDLPDRIFLRRILLKLIRNIAGGTSYLHPCVESWSDYLRLLGDPFFLKNFLLKADKTLY